MAKLDRTTLNKVIDEIQMLIDENYSCDNVDQKIGYQLGLYKVQNLVYSLKLKNV